MYQVVEVFVVVLEYWIVVVVVMFDQFFQVIVEELFGGLLEVLDVLCGFQVMGVDVFGVVVDEIGYLYFEQQVQGEQQQFQVIVEYVFFLFMVVIQICFLVNILLFYQRIYLLFCCKVQFLLLVSGLVVIIVIILFGVVFVWKFMVRLVFFNCVGLNGVWWVMQVSLLEQKVNSQLLLLIRVLNIFFL